MRTTLAIACGFAIVLLAVKFIVPLIGAIVLGYGVVIDLRFVFLGPALLILLMAAELWLIRSLRASNLR